MANILVPVDGSESSHRALQHAIDLGSRVGKTQIHLLNVQPPILSGEVVMFVGQATISKFRQEESEQALNHARALLHQSGLAYSAHAKVGTSPKRSRVPPRSSGVTSSSWAPVEWAHSVIWFWVRWRLR